MIRIKSLHFQGSRVISNSIPAPVIMILSHKCINLISVLTVRDMLSARADC